MVKKYMKLLEQARYQAEEDIKFHKGQQKTYLGYANRGMGTMYQTIVSEQRSKQLKSEQILIKINIVIASIIEIERTTFI
jgi:hypothetical protein